MSPPNTVERLRKRSQFLLVRNGYRAVRPTVLIEARQRAPDGPIGLGFTASSKIGGAVVRNRAKRRLREAARQALPEFGQAGVDYVFVARRGTPDAAWDALLDDVRNALIRLRAELAEGRAERAPWPRSKRPSPPKESE
ncbi:MAG: ribonuclease P protein component [Hyphomonadaceae bacterium]|nr:ribonuclease P protein component [Hyphomonadaceae bacterium]